MRRRRAIVSALARFVVVCALVFVASLLACGSGDRPLDEVDPGAVSANPTYDEVFAILHNRCVTCHSGEDDDARDDQRLTSGGISPDLSDCVEIVAFAGDIVVQVEGNTMPPGAMPRLTNEEKLTIRRWFSNGAEAPCN
jgi:uncharacterized membrane protein